MIILDTDVFSFLELPDSPEYLRLSSRIAQLDPPVPVAVTIITYEEQSRGRLAAVNSAKTQLQLKQTYAYLLQHIRNYQQIPLLEFDDAAISIASELRKAKVRIGTMDLRIAAIAIANAAILITRNLNDFQKVPHLRVEDWTKS